MKNKYSRLSLFLVLAMALTMMSGEMVFAETEESSEDVQTGTVTETEEENEEDSEEESTEDSEEVSEEEVSEEDSAEDEEETSEDEATEDATSEEESESSEDETADESSDETADESEEEESDTEDESEEEEEESETEYEGTVIKSEDCGSDTIFTLYDSGLLVISGSGEVDIPVISMIDDYESVTSIVIEEGVTSLGTYALQGFTNATSVTFPSTLTTIGAFSFYGLSMTEIVIPASVTEIGAYAFSECRKLERVTINGSPTIKEFAFENCISLTYVDIAGGVVEAYAFAGTGLTAQSDGLSLGEEVVLDELAFDTLSLSAEVVSYEDGVLVISSNFEPIRAFVMVYGTYIDDNGDIAYDFSKIYDLSEGTDFTWEYDGDGLTTITISEDFFASLEDGSYYLHSGLYYSDYTGAGGEGIYLTIEASDAEDSEDEESDAEDSEADEDTEADEESEDEDSEADEEESETETDDDADSETVDAVDTGDHSQLKLWTVMLLISGCALAGMTVLKVKRR